MKNLEQDNILLDYGEIDSDEVKKLEKELNISLPSSYVDFVTKHNGASIFARIFDYQDPNMKSGRNSDSIAFVRFEEIENKINRLKKADGNFPGYGTAFEDGLVPFGTNGGGDLICFDYRNDRITDNPPIVIWNHDMGLEHRVVFIANNFEEFVNMLYFNEELEKYLDELYPSPKRK
ncbi:MAG: SMI1/KNR4 family protein [Puniceicoccales bacterium]|nr:SMI1/KNR4 family protein [Puniceicoccales bacterium]